VISEVFYDASGSDDGHSFVELFAAAGSVLDGLTLEGRMWVITPILLDFRGAARVPIRWAEEGNSRCRPGARA